MFLQGRPPPRDSGCSFSRPRGTQRLRLPTTASQGHLTAQSARAAARVRPPLPWRRHSLSGPAGRPETLSSVPLRPAASELRSSPGTFSGEPPSLRALSAGGPQLTGLPDPRPWSQSLPLTAVTSPPTPGSPEPPFVPLPGTERPWEQRALRPVHLRGPRTVVASTTTQGLVSWRRAGHPGWLRAAWGTDVVGSLSLAQGSPGPGARGRGCFRGPRAQSEGRDVGVRAEGHVGGAVLVGAGLPELAYEGRCHRRR